MFSSFLTHIVLHFLNEICYIIETSLSIFNRIICIYVCIYVSIYMCVCVCVYICMLFSCLLHISQAHLKNVLKAQVSVLLGRLTVMQVIV